MLKKSYKISERLLSLKIIDSVGSYVLFIHSNSKSDHKSFVMLLKKHVGFYLLIFEIFLLHGLFSAALDFVHLYIALFSATEMHGHLLIFKMMKAGAQVLLSEMVWKCFCFFDVFFLCFWKMKISFNYFHLSAEKKYDKKF